MQPHPNNDRANTQGACDRCGQVVYRFRGQGDLQCSCGAFYNCFGQRLRDDLRSRPNESEINEDIGDLEGFEQALLRADNEG